MSCGSKIRFSSIRIFKSKYYAYSDYIKNSAPYVSPSYFLFSENISPFNTSVDVREKRSKSGITYNVVINFEINYDEQINNRLKKLANMDLACILRDTSGKLRIVGNDMEPLRISFSDLFSKDESKNDVIKVRLEGNFGSVYF